MFQRVSRRARAERARIFLDAVQPPADARILDLGGGTGEHIASIFPPSERITVADHSERDLDIARRRGLATVRLDGAEALPFADGEFDVIFCSSVIEHITGPKEAARACKDGKLFDETGWRLQQQFAAEVRRCAKSYFVQTPHRSFPVESHSWVPLLETLPRGAKVDLLVFLREKGIWPRKIVNIDWRLLDTAEMQTLFPDAEVRIERLFGMPKSLMAIRRWPGGASARSPGVAAFATA